MTGGGFDFAGQNLRKVFSSPLYALSWLLSLVVPRARDRWAFGSGAGFGEGAAILAAELRRRDPAARITWLVATAADAAAAKQIGYETADRSSWRGYWATLRAGHLVITHGFGDVNRFAVFGARITHLGHGVPLKRLHLDSPVTTALSGPAPVRWVLHRMYRAGGRRIELYVAGSVDAAERLRSAYRVAPGRVRVLGDPRTDVIAAQAQHAPLVQDARATVAHLLGLPAENPAPWVLYAPTWRDGAEDPAVPTATELVHLRRWLDAHGAHLVIRPHPLGAGPYRSILGPRVHWLGADVVPEITPLLAAFDAVITDYSSLAVDVAILSRPVVWFAPDLESYTATRGLYEPLTVTAAGRVQPSWDATLAHLAAVLEPGGARDRAIADAKALAARFVAFPQGGAAQRVLDEIQRLARSARERIPIGTIFFESFYGRQVTCNPAALDREIARRFPELPRLWSVVSERVEPPPGATPVLVGGPDWVAARRHARLLIVNDWVRGGFRRRRGQTVLQTWHGTMLKHLALTRPAVGVRTRLAIHRERRRWSLLLSQNAHATAQFRASYAYRGEVLEVGYPRTDRLATSLAGDSRSPVVVAEARRALGLPRTGRVVAYVPTWRDASDGLVDPLGVRALADELGEEWTVVARGHTRTHGTGRYDVGATRVIDASQHPDVNDVLLAADVVVTDYSSVMFDAAVARIPLIFFVPDLERYRDRERGFTFDFEGSAPGPLLRHRQDLVRLLDDFARTGTHAEWVTESTVSAEHFRRTFTPMDDGRAAERVVDALVDRGLLPGA